MAVDRATMVVKVDPQLIELLREVRDSIGRMTDRARLQSIANAQRMRAQTLRDVERAWRAGGVVPPQAVVAFFGQAVMDAECEAEAADRKARELK